MKRRQEPIDPSETTGEPTSKKFKVLDDSSDSELSAPSSSRARRTRSSAPVQPAQGSTKSRSNGKEPNSSSSSAKLLSPTPKRGSSNKITTSTSPRASTPSGKKKGGANSISMDVDDVLSPPLSFVPKYVDYYLLPGTTLTLHRKEFVVAELKYTAKAMSTKLSSKVSRAIKRGEYIPRAQLAADAPLQRPAKLESVRVALKEPINEIAMELRQNRKEPQRSV